MVREPSVFLLDEPLSNLDAKLRTEMRNRISMLHKELETTFVYVTHDQTEAMTMADRIVVMKDGVIQQFDTPQMLYNHPKNLFVAGFIGSPQMNFILCKIKKSGKNYVAVTTSNVIALPDRMNDYLLMYENKDVILGVRPEDMSIAEKTDNTNVVEVYIDIVEMTGADYYMYGELDGKKIIANVSSSMNIKSDKKYKLKIDVDRIHIFDKINERLICD